MADETQLAARVQEHFRTRRVPLGEQRMMGGICFMVDGKMCAGVRADRLMVRLDPEKAKGLEGRPGVTPMVHGGRPMRGFLFIDANGTRSDEALRLWLDLALEFNPRATSSKTKRSKSLS